jgi:hypothetical protein
MGTASEIRAAVSGYTVQCGVHLSCNQAGEMISMIPHLIVRSITDFLCPDTVSPDSLRPPHCDGIRPRPPLAHSPVRTPGGHSGWHLLPAFSSLYVVACTPIPSFSKSYCEIHSPMSFPMGQRRGHTDVCQFSHMRTVGKSDRTPSTRHPTHHHQSRESVCKQRTALYHCHCVPFPTKGGN